MFFILVVFFLLSFSSFFGCFDLFGLFSVSSFRFAIFRFLRFPPQAAQNLSDECKDLIHKLIEPNANRRYKIDQILCHPWLTQIPSNEITPTPVVVQRIGLDPENSSTTKGSSSHSNQAHKDNSNSEHSHQQQQAGKNGNTNNKFWW